MIEFGVESVLIAIVFFVVWWLRSYSNPSLKAKPFALPILGHALDFQPAMLLDALLSYPKKYGGLVAVMILNVRTYLVTDLDLAKKVLSARPKFLKRTTEYSATAIGTYGGLFDASGCAWSRVRRLTAPSFSQQNIKKKFGGFVERANAFSDRLQDASVSNTPIDMKLAGFHYTIEILTIMAFGFDISDPINAYFLSEGFLFDVLDLFRFTLQYCLFPLPAWLWRYCPQYQTEVTARVAAVRMADAARSVIAYRRQLLEQGLVEPSAMIDTLIMRTQQQQSSDSPDALTEEELVTHVKTTYIAGAETTSIGIAWSAFIFAQRPDIVAKLREEIIIKLLLPKAMSFEEMIDELSMDDLMALQYAQAMIKEIFRLYSSASLLPLQLEADVTSFKLTEETSMKQGDMVWVNIDGIARDPSIFTNPLHFDPDRWLTATDTMESAILTFGGGSRVCPGIQLAKCEFLLALVVMVWRFEFQLACPATEIKRVIALSSSPHKMPVFVTPRVM